MTSDDRETQEARGNGLSAVGRYSLFVGLAFVALIVDRDVQHAPDARRRHPRHRRGRRRSAAAAVRGARARVRFAGRRRQHLPGRLRDRPRTRARRAAHPGLPGRPDGGDPRLRPVRQAAGDLVLVHRAGPTACRPRTRSTGSPSASRARSTSSRSTSATSATRRARSSSERGWTSRSAGTPTAPSPTSTGSASARPSRSPIPAGIFAEARSGHRLSSPRPALTDERRAAASASRDERAQSRPMTRRARQRRAGSRPSCSRSSRRSRCATRPSSAARAAVHARAARTACASSPTASPAPQAVNLRHQPIPWAYRVFFRHIGLDPDEQRTPVEELALERMKDGGFKSQSLLDDALTIAIVESGVALRAFDADRVEGRPRDPARARRRSSSRAGPASCPPGRW